MTSLITVSGKSYYGVLRMRDFPAGRLKRLKKLETSFFQRPGRRQITGPVEVRLRFALSYLKCTVPFFLPADHLVFPATI